jgi:hypothetical protein
LIPFIEDANNRNIKLFGGRGMEGVKIDWGRGMEGVKRD